MADYGRYKTETLKKMEVAAWEKYYELTCTPLGNWGDGCDYQAAAGEAWERARERLCEIRAELDRRKGDGSGG